MQRVEGVGSGLRRRPVDSTWNSIDAEESEGEPDGEEVDKEELADDSSFGMSENDLGLLRN